jgi:uncharacterized protein YodC (DUF2158 family)
MKKVTTITREYDSYGKCISEVTVEEDLTAKDAAASPSAPAGSSEKGASPSKSDSPAGNAPKRKFKVGDKVRSNCPCCPEDKDKIGEVVGLESAGNIFIGYTVTGFSASTLYHDNNMEIAKPRVGDWVRRINEDFASQKVGDISVVTGLRGLYDFELNGDDTVGFDRNKYELLTGPTPKFKVGDKVQKRYGGASFTVARITAARALQNRFRYYDSDGNNYLEPDVEAYVEPPYEFKNGDRVKLIDGAFAGIKGTVIGLNATGKGRYVVKHNASDYPHANGYALWSSKFMELV